MTGRADVEGVSGTASGMWSIAATCRPSIRAEKLGRLALSYFILERDTQLVSKDGDVEDMNGNIGPILRLMFLLTGILLVATVACGDDATRTGVPEVDRVIEALENEDVDTLASLMAYHEVPCGSPDGIPAPPPCPPGEEDGSPVEVWLSAECQGIYITAAETKPALQARLGDADVSIYAVYRLDSFGDLDTDHAIVIRNRNAPEAVGGYDVYVSNGQLVALTATCGTVASSASDLEAQGAEAVIPPRDA